MVTYDMDRRGGLSKYAYLFRCLRHDIRTGALPAGERLPSKRSLAEHLSLSVGTIERAYGELVSEGYLTARVGSGFYVAHRSDWGVWGGLEGEREQPRAPEGEPCKEDADDGPRFDLRANRSSMTLFPADTWSRIMRKTLSERSPALFETVPFNGTRELREAIATHLFEFRGIHASPDNIVIGAGTEYLYGRLLQLLGPAANIAMGDPGYRRLADVSRNVGTLWSYVPVSAEGMRVDLLAASGANVMHVSPANLFPLGVALPDDDRASLLAWLAERPQHWLIEDDYDSEFSFAQRERPPLLTQDATGRIIYLNTFSKTLVPSIRISYMVLPDELLDLYHEQLSFYSCTVSSFEQLALAEFMRGGHFERHIHRLRRHFAHQRQRILDALARSPLAGVSRVRPSEVGTHLLLEVDTNLPDAQVKRNATKLGMNVAMLTDYCSRPSAFSIHQAVINYAGIDAAYMPRAATILAQAFHVSPEHACS